MLTIRFKYWYKVFKINLASWLMRLANKVDSKTTLESSFAVTEAFYDEFEEWSINRTINNA
jgi:hypothetical protein